KAIRFLIFFVQQVFDLAEQSEIFYCRHPQRERIVRRKVEYRVAAFDGRAKGGCGSKIIAASNDIGTEINIPAVVEIIQVHASAISRAPRQFAIRGIPVEISVIGVRVERVEKLNA